MRAGVTPSATRPIWSGPEIWTTIADIFVVLIALALPWSTSLVAIFAVMWLLTVVPTLDSRFFLQIPKRPICVLPIALFALAAIGTFWSDAPWGTRLYAISPTIKLLVLPPLFYHFERSSRGMWVFVAFLASCSLLMVMSWIVAVDPRLALKSGAAYGVPIKNYIDQSQEFVLCATALAYPITTFLRTKRFVLAAILAALAVSFVVNMMFITVSRTALVTMPVMLAVFALLHLQWRHLVLLACIIPILAGGAWVTSPTLRATIASFSEDYRLYKERNEATSMGMRMEFWQKSLQFFVEAPVIGHGTGSTRGLFEQAATGPQILAAGQVIGNPHNQTLNVAIQWGGVGIVLLYSMWWCHLLLFRGDGLVASIGLLVVVQNIFTSLFNSHLFDFHEGWMYVLGVGVAGGTVLRRSSYDNDVDPD
jgi:O-antigen ligase